MLKTKRVLIYLSLSLFILFILSVIFLVFKKQNPSIGTFLPLFLAVLFLFIIPLLLNFQAKSTFKKNKKLHEIQKYVINAEGINITAETYEVNLSWDKILKVIEYREVIMLYLTKDRVYIVPKRFISEIYRNFCDILHSNLNQDKLSLKR